MNITNRGFLHRVAEWNSARYPERTLNIPLTYQLLHEEIHELFEATTEVDVLDALVDIIYVATGAMYKMGLDESHMYNAIHAVCDANDSKAIDKVASDVKANLDKGPDFVGPEPRLQEILDERV